MSHIDLPEPLGSSLGITASIAPENTPPLFRTDSDEFLKFMCPVLGPSATIIAHQTTSWLRARGEGFVLDTVDFAGVFGLVPQTLAKALHRLSRFGQMGDQHGWLVFYITVNYYPARWIERLPKGLAGELVEWQRLVVVGQ